MNKFIIIIVTLFLFLPATTSAQGVGTTGAQSLNLTVSPETPGANTTVRTSVKSFGTDLNSDQISWFLDGSLADRGVGKTNFSFTTGDTGQRMTLSVVVLTTDGDTLETTRTLVPGEVDVIWESLNSYAPPFYKGKSMYSHEDTLVFVAVPHLFSSSGAKLNPDQLIYTWRKNGRVLGSLSGYGRQTLTLSTNNLDQRVSVGVTVSTPDGTLKAGGSATAERTTAKTYIYRKDPLMGVLSNQLITETFLMNEDETTFIAYPFFFGVNSALSQNIEYDWFLEGREISSQGNTSTFKKSGESGSAQIRAGANHLGRLLQKASESFILQFESR